MIQIDIEMPKTCYDCPLAMMRYNTLFRRGKQISNEFSCVLTHKAITSTKRNRFCPLRELVRCKDCAYWLNAEVNEKGFVICPASGMEITEDDFCSYGEKVTE